MKNIKKRIFRYLKHISITFFVVIPILFVIGLLSLGGGIHYGDNPKRLDWNNEGPYVFYKNDSTINVNYIKGNKKEGYSLEQQEYHFNSHPLAKSFFALDSSEFAFNIQTNFEIPKTTYNDQSPILAISDIESGYKTFRNFLINSQVIDKNLNWTFGKGHLVLVGDFVDRGFSTTQVLWFIYKLEQEAKKHGGTVHFILGNHELKNMYGDYGAASLKYTFVSSILGKTQSQLYDQNSLIGKWLSSKNVIEKINGHVFTHGGLHPDLIDTDYSLEEINTLLRKTYYTAPYPKAKKTDSDILISSKDGPAWYRGYFREDLEQESVDNVLNHYDAKDVIVGHTVQSKVNKSFNGRVIGIDISHPKDYHKNWPKKESEALLIEGENYYRVLSGGKKKILK